MLLKSRTALRQAHLTRFLFDEVYLGFELSSEIHEELDSSRLLVKLVRSEYF